MIANRSYFWHILVCADNYTIFKLFCKVEAVRELGG